MYNGELKRYKRKTKKNIDIKSLILWYCGILISFIPVVVDVVAYLATHETLDIGYWITMCLRGDLLWVLATIIVVTVIDYVSDTTIKRGILQQVCVVVAVVMWGIAFGLWIIFKYVYPVDYGKNVPIVLTLIVAAITIICCSPLQVKEVEK